MSHMIQIIETGDINKFSSCFPENTYYTIQTYKRILQLTTQLNRHFGGPQAVPIRKHFGITTASGENWLQLSWLVLDRSSVQKLCVGSHHI